MLRDTNRPLTRSLLALTRDTKHAAPSTSAPHFCLRMPNSLNELKNGPSGISQKPWANGGFLYGDLLAVTVFPT